MHFYNSFGVDLGTSTLKIYNQKNDTITKEKNRIAVRNGEEVLAIGNEAYEMYEKTPQNIRVSTPMVNGRISDVFYLEAVLHTLLSRSSTSVIYRPSLYFAVSTDLTQIERRAYYAVAHRGKLRKCRIYLVDKPIADAIALGIPLSRTKGSMLVNMGSQCTEVSVVADARVIISKQIPIGGGQFSESIRSNIRRKNNLQVGMRTARRLKLSLCDMMPEKKEGRKIMGMDCTSGIPRDGIVTSTTVNSAVKEKTDQICEEIRTVLERTPPQIRANIAREGIYLTGGSTRIPNMDRYLSQSLECSVQLSLYYDLCTICGLKELINHSGLHRFAYPVTRQ